MINPCLRLSSKVQTEAERAPFSKHFRSPHLVLRCDILNYLEDVNRSLLTREDRYLSDYVTMRGEGEGREPSIGLNGEPPKHILGQSIEHVRNIVARLEGNFFSQECSRSLVTMPSQELGAQITGAFSEIAAKALEYVETALEASEPTKEHSIRIGRCVEMSFAGKPF